MLRTRGRRGRILRFHARLRRGWEVTKLQIPEGREEWMGQGGEITPLNPSLSFSKSQLQRLRREVMSFSFPRSTFVFDYPHPLFKGRPGRLETEDPD